MIKFKGSQNLKEKQPSYQLTLTDLIKSLSYLQKVPYLVDTTDSIAKSIFIIWIIFSDQDEQEMRENTFSLVYLALL